MHMHTREVCVQCSTSTTSKRSLVYLYTTQSQTCQVSCLSRVTGSFSINLRVSARLEFVARI